MCILPVLFTVPPLISLSQILHSICEGAELFPHKKGVVLGGRGQIVKYSLIALMSGHCLVTYFYLLWKVVSSHFDDKSKDQLFRILMIEQRKLSSFLGNKVGKDGIGGSFWLF